MADGNRCNQKSLAVPIAVGAVIGLCILALFLPFVVMMQSIT